MEPIDVIKKLKQAKKAADKIEVLKEAWEAECNDFFEGMHLAFNPLIVFNLNKVPRIIEEDDEPDNLGFTNFRRFALEIHYGQIKNTKKHVEDALNTSSVEAWNEWYRKILSKNFGNLITVAQLNKFLNSIEQTDLLIPVFKHQNVQKSWQNHHRYNINYFVDPYIPGDRLLTVLRKVPTSVFFFDEKGKQATYHDLEDFENLIEHLPVDVLLDGVYSEGRYYVFDIMPYDEYRLGKVERPIEDRHKALCDMQELFVDTLGSKVRILPKKKVMITTRSQIKSVISEFLMLGYDSVVFKKADSGYLPGTNSTYWIHEIP